MKTNAILFLYIGTLYIRILSDSGGWVSWFSFEEYVKPGGCLSVDSERSREIEEAFQEYQK